jgi:hypothetical protein
MDGVPRAIGAVEKAYDALIKMWEMYAREALHV